MTTLAEPPLNTTTQLTSPPDLIITVYGTPAPQGSKRHVGNGVMLEMSKRLKPWRQDVKEAALIAMELPSATIGAVQLHRPLLDGPLAASIVFTIREQPAGKPTWWPGGVRWSKSLRWRPASTPDLSKLLRSTEDALTGVAWKDDARVVEYTRLAKYYVGHDADDVIPHTTGAVIRIWKLTEVTR
ncbi:RusA family crossover junction endodeoxyribonuclease [Kitasatospora mediocidica]|uniref:RusA family crossover junction endodeoxyribonuclease n=1 Tax=Kitasatospora mediocidica TaxID=58352 RepID=UPI0006893B22|nr:RusA family crossover junction endodeoxyribonuclease [Kitasatospora mediocidica]